MVPALLATSLLAATGQAEVVRLEIQQREPFAAEHAFGDAGSYERITGSLHLAVDPAHPSNTRIVDLKRAPRNSAGQVEFRADFFLLAPANPGKGNGCLLYDVNNRGNKLILAAINEARSNDPRSLADAGNGFLMRRGYPTRDVHRVASGDVIHQLLRQGYLVEEDVQKLEAAARERAFWSAQSRPTHQ